MRKTLLLCLLLLCCCVPLSALAVTELTVTPREMGFDYEITTGEEWLVLLWDSANEDGRKTLYSADGHFTGSIDLPYSAAGGKYTVTVQNLKQTRLVKQTIQVPQSADYVAPSGSASAKVSNFTLTETSTGFKYSFSAPGSDYMLLYFRSKQENATFPVYPVNADGLYEGEIFAPLTYARTLFTVQVRTAKGTVRCEETVRKGYEAPEPAEQQEGRLSGVVVCIDPGHQENGQYVNEPIGPGLSGSSTGKGGMAQGVVTLRKEAIVTLETGMILRDLLLQEGATVVMTRETQDVFHSNIERCEIAAEAGAHIMLRLHCDNNSNANKTGLSVYAPLNSDYARAVASPEEYRALGEAFIDEMKKAVGYALTDKTGFVHLNDNYIGNNWAQMVCFLVEMGYMSNAGEDIKLATPEYQTMLAQGMVEGVYQVALMRGWVEEKLE